LKVRRWRTIYHANGCEKKARVSILILDKIDFKTKILRIDKEVHYIVIKGTIQRDHHITIVKIYAANMGEAKYIKWLIAIIKALIHSNTVIVGDFNTSFT